MIWQLASTLTTTGFWVRAAFLAATYFGMQKMAKKAMPKFEGMPIEVTREPAPMRRVIYGRVRAGGPMLFAALRGTTNATLYLIVGYAGHEVDAVEDTVFVNDESKSVITYVGGKYVDGFMVGAAAKFSTDAYLGTDSQAASAGIIATFPGVWTTNHRLRGIAYALHILIWDTKLWPSGLPNVSGIIRGKKCYDPRTTTTVWTTNPALCLRDYLTDTKYGLRTPTARIDDDSFIAAANVCDEAVSLAAGGTEARYRMSGVFDVEVEPGEVVESMLATMAGSLFYAGGKWRVLAGADRAVTRAAITTADLAGPISVSTRSARGDAFNRVKGKFTSIADNWSATDFPAVTNATYLAEDAGEELWLDMDLTWVFSVTQAQRLAKIAMERSRQDITVSLVCNLSVLDVQCGDVVPLTLSRYGWTNKPFQVIGWGLSVSADGACTIALELREYASSVWSWSSGEETTFDAAPNTDLPDSRIVADPTSLALYSGASYGLAVAADGTVISPLVATWTAAADDGVTSGGAYEIATKLNAASDWSSASIVPGDSTRWTINGLTPGASYDVRIRSVNGVGVVGNWVTVTAHALAGDSTAPASPSGVAAGTPATYGANILPQIALGNNKYAIIVWTRPTETDFAYTEVRICVGNDVTSAQVESARHDRPDNRHQISLAGNHAYGATYGFLRHVDLTGNASAWVGTGSLASAYGEANGDLIMQNADAAVMSGLQQGAAGASSVRKVLARYIVGSVVTLAGGSPTESFDLSLSNRGFGTAPDSGVLSTDDSALDIFYWKGSGSTTSTNARCVAVSRSGGNITAGDRLIMGELVEFD
jgi:hypothetical protein